MASVRTSMSASATEALGLLGPERREDGCPHHDPERVGGDDVPALGVIHTEVGPHLLEQTHDRELGGADGEAADGEGADGQRESTAGQAHGRGSGGGTHLMS
ncbi:hypothetical protein MN0502_12600 [Arthrobacter sp. MN05-02]|nr:hypothetical protein MN0502_12600 [Arthrobacter sp. MN05-02]